MAEYSGEISYVNVTDRVTKVQLHLQGTVVMTRGFFEYPATPVWQTVWRVYDDYGKLLWEDSRQHSIMFVHQSDSAFDDITIELRKLEYYNVQLWGQLGEPKLVTTRRVDISQPLQPTPPPVIEPPADVAPLEPPTPPNGAPGPIDWSKWTLPVVIVAVGLIVLTPARKKGK